MGKKVPIFELHADSQTEGLLAASYATRRVTSPIAALPAPCCSAYYCSKPEKPPMTQPEARFLSFQPGFPPGAFKLLRGSSEAKVTLVGCAVGPPITGQFTLEGIPVLGLVDTGASVTCLGFSVWWCYHAQWRSLRQFEGTVHAAHGKPLQIAGKT